MGYPSESVHSGHNDHQTSKPQPPDHKSSKSSKTSRTTKRPSKSSRPSRRISRHQDPALLSTPATTPTPSITSAKDPDTAMSDSSTRHGTSPSYDDSYSFSNGGNDAPKPLATSSRPAGGAGPTGGPSTGSNRSDSCHFVMSPEMQLVDNLVAILAQNRARAQKGGKGGQ